MTVIIKAVEITRLPQRNKNNAEIKEYGKNMPIHTNDYFITDFSRNSIGEQPIS
ncbi:hypothetical protein [Sphingobacterium hotanense]|uniref:hypothetical protein n=1 Tax=Sphingobacterium hotanense TaxID=649196 RepID=UPI00165976D1|nr:hypothetical protein [Sphingobacterium hotanense]